MKTTSAVTAALLAAAGNLAHAGEVGDLSADSPGLLALGAVALVVGVQAIRRKRRR
jgi:hypothetical protein